MDAAFEGRATHREGDDLSLPRSEFHDAEAASVELDGEAFGAAGVDEEVDVEFRRRLLPVEHALDARGVEGTEERTPAFDGRELLRSRQGEIRSRKRARSGPVEDEAVVVDGAVRRVGDQRAFGGDRPLGCGDRRSGRRRRRGPRGLLR